MVKKVTAKDVRNAIRERYEAQGGVIVLEEVASSSGFMKTAVDMGVLHNWPSANFRRSAFEIKVDRSDFLHERATPDKNLWCFEFFHEFWYVTTPGVIKDGTELPEGAGWLELKGGRLYTRRQATTRKTAKLTEGFMGAVLNAMKRSVTSDNKRRARVQRDEDEKFHEEDLKALREVVEKVVMIPIPEDASLFTLSEALENFKPDERAAKIAAWTNRQLEMVRAGVEGSVVRLLAVACSERGLVDGRWVVPEFFGKGEVDWERVKNLLPETKKLMKLLKEGG